MRDLHYKGYSFKLNEETYLRLKVLKEKKSKTWNLMFLDLINLYEKKEKEV